MKKVFLVLGLVMGLVGCEQETVVGCDNDTVQASDPSKGAPFALSPNQPCNVKAECALDECVSTVDPLSGYDGVCWSEAFVGCAVVNFEGWVIDAFCGTRRLEICQTAMTPEMETRCDPPVDSLAPWIANFQCCDP